MSKSVFGATALAVSAVSFVGPANADDPARPQSEPCPFVRTIDNFQALDNYSAILETGPSHRYKVTFVNSCYQLKWAQTARIEARPGVCLRKGDVLSVGYNGFVDRCFISSIERVPPKPAKAPTAS